ncbi:hypothetical protein [Amycolatopsis keratiniphila]|uniref:hypothetical protein n=1 Tax=Amycolatopsis keratiniphila TaxID=129921 RepID=UPI003F4D5739
MAGFSASGVEAVWVDDALYFKGGPGTRRSRNLAANPACAVSVRLRGIDLTMEGEAHRVTDPATLERVAAVYRTGGWPATGHRGGGHRTPWRHPLGLHPLTSPAQGT